MILCSGAFDGIHAGHVRYLSAAKALCQPGEPLYVAVAPDSYIRRSKKRKPYWTQTERVEALRALRMIDVAFHECSPSIADCVRRFKPRVFAKGPDWIGKVPMPVLKACAAVRAELIFTDTPGRHVSEARG